MQVLLADDQAEIRSALRLLLEQEPGLRVVGETARVEDLPAKVRAVQPDLLLLDWELPKEAKLCCPAASKRRLLERLYGLQPDLKVIAMSGRPEARAQALAAGADGFVSKVESPERLLAAVRAVGSSSGETDIGQ